MATASLKKNTIYNILKSCSTVLFPLITFPYASRVLLPDNVGKINFAAAFISYFALIASLGCSAYAIRECSGVRDDREKMGHVASQIFSINVYSTLASLVLLALSLLLFRELDNYRLLIVIQASTIVFTTVGTDWVNSATEDFGYITLRTFFFQLVSLVAIFLFVKTPDDYVKYAIISVVSSSGANILNVFYCRRFCRITFHVKPAWKKHIKPILLLFTMILAQTIFKNTDITMLGLMKGDFEVGIYSTAIKIYNIINQFVTSIMWVLLPRVSYLFTESNREELHALLRKALSFLAGLGLPIVAGVIVTAPDIVMICAGAEYMGATLPLRILMIAFFFSLFGGGFMGNIIMIPSGKESHFLKACAIAAVANVILNFLLIPLYGESAAALTTGIAEIIIFFVLLPHTRATVNLRGLVKIFLAPLVGSVAILAVGTLLCCLIPTLWLRFTLTVAACVAVYGVVLLLMRYELLMDTLTKLLGKFKGSRSLE